ncbi:MAG TPA: DUF58 domain-containing protein [Acidimicrobiales bacterium]|jgi:uncharacterized protein (DUF58 family)|nr:DUF58 domain-containing protein [Acidimicrobiales bacterium]
MTVGPASDEILRRLELTITRKLDGLLQGEYQGLIPGHGSELGEARVYQPGDDTRRIDWNVTARMRSPHVRETIADRELETWLLIDQSASLDFGTAQCEKRDLVLNAAAAVGFLTSRNGNRLGAMLLQPGAEPVIVPARSGRVHLQAILHRMINAPRMDGAGPTDLATGMQRMGSVMRRRGLAVVISDWLDPSPWPMPMRHLAVRHEVLAVEVVDPRELALADVGLLELVDPETGQVYEVQTSDARLRERYATAAAAQRDEIDRNIRASAADHVKLRTDSDWLLDLVRFVISRRRNRQSVAPTIVV